MIPQLKKEDILGFKIFSGGKDECIHEIIKCIALKGGTKYFVCANVYSLEIAKKDIYFTNAIKNADLIIPDGIGVVFASRFLGGNIQERITGWDIFHELSLQLNSAGSYSYYFLGSTEDTLCLIRKRMLDIFPNINIAGSYSPPFSDLFSYLDNNKIINSINRVKPDVLWVGMTAPKQEKWIFENRQKLDVKLIGGVGAVFDFFAGNVKRAPLVMQENGLEWLYRFLIKPSRFWRRDLTIPPFIGRVVKERIKKLYRCNISGI